MKKRNAVSVVKDGLIARNLIEEILQILCITKSGKEIFFRDAISVVINIDSHGRAKRAGYMSYDGVILIQVGKRLWALCRGIAWGDYPADQFDSDLIVFEIPEPGKKSENEILKAVQDLIQSGEYFKNSIMIAQQNGEFVISSNRENIFAKKIAKTLELLIKDFVAREAQLHIDFPGTISAKSIVIQQTRYSIKLAKALAKEIEKILNES